MPPKPWQAAGGSAGSSASPLGASTAHDGVRKPWEVSGTVMAGDSEAPQSATTSSLYPAVPPVATGGPLAQTGPGTTPYNQYNSSYAAAGQPTYRGGYGDMSGRYGMGGYGMTGSQFSSPMFSRPGYGPGTYGMAGSYGTYGSYGGLGSSYAPQYSSPMYGSYSPGGYGGAYNNSLYNRGYGGNPAGGGYGAWQGPNSPQLEGPEGPMGPGGPPGSGGDGKAASRWERFMHVMHGAVMFFSRISFLMDENAHAVHFFVTALLQLLDRASYLWGEIARFVLRLLGYRRALGRGGDLKGAAAQKTLEAAWASQ